MKNALFSGISTNKKDDSSDDDDVPRKQETRTEPANDLNLLDMDDSNNQQQPVTSAGSGSNNLLDIDLDSSNTGASQQSMNSQFDLLSLGQPQPVAQPAAPTP